MFLIYRIGGSIYYRPKVESSVINDKKRCGYGLLIKEWNDLWPLKPFIGHDSVTEEGDLCML
jgi:hypothetical protein